jgi:hypothetical protein
MVHDLVKGVDELKVDMQSFLVSPTRWRTSRVSVPLIWTFLPFTGANRARVPEQAGIYAFIVRHANNHFPEHGFIMYIGITGADANGRTLRARYGEYLREQRTEKRPKVHYMLTKYSDDIQFAYSVPDANIDLGQLELDLNDAIIPPVVVKDFTAEIRHLVKALR